MNLTPPLKPESYLWKPISHEPLVWQRPALAGECMWIPRPKELRELFVCSSLTLNSPIPRETFNARVRQAWRLLRFKVPELGVSTTCGEDGKLYMQYHTPKNQEVEEWIDRTHYCQSGEYKRDFEIVRGTLLAIKQGRNSDNSLLLSRAIHEKGAELVKHSQIMICVDHQVADGIGARILFGKFLALLASSLGIGPVAAETEIKWEDSYHNLSQPWICFMNADQILSGSKYEETAANNREVLLNQMKNNPGLPLLETPRPPTQETHFITLSTAQTAAILNAIKQVASPNFNITHLGHAATVVALLRSIPASLTTSSQTLYSPCWLNGRRYLQSSGAEPGPEPTKSYIPICQSFAPVVFPDLQGLALSSSAGTGEVRDVLVKACRIATAEYGKIKASKSMLPECVVLFEELGEGMALKNRELSLEQNNPSSIQERNQTDEPPPTADPFFLSDGLTEHYISHSYPSPPLISSSLSSLTSNTPSPEPAFTVDDVQFAANAEKNLIVRMSSWRGRTTISGEWRGCDFDRDLIVRFLEDVVAIMLSIVVNDEEV
ncbi:hypothetical protein EG329_010283 [Mollisiaceae sp. DMI_Dod_QoI]|nr:hypothetical protein EG329_010283 [Helotiales sp. DMI_Dod_QoI]